MKTGTVFERIKYYYDKGLYTETHLQKFLEKNVITEDEYISIVQVTVNDTNETESANSNTESEETTTETSVDETETNAE